MLNSKFTAGNSILVSRAAAGILPLSLGDNHQVVSGQRPLQRERR
jgi:hypothetical protein